MQPVVAYSPYPGAHPHQRLHHLHHHHAPPIHQQQLHHHLLHQPQQLLHHDVYAPQPQQTYHAPLLLAPAYRPLQIPLQLQQQLQHSSPVVAPDQQQQASTPAAFPSHQANAPDPGLHLHHHNSHGLHSNHSQHPVAVQAAYPQQQRRDRSQQSSMAYQPSDEEMAEMQRLSAAYESEATVCIDVSRPVFASCCCNSPTISDSLYPMNPNADYCCCSSQGPLVGQRQPSSAITQEYATADATYQTKTAVCIHQRSLRKYSCH